MKRDPRIDSELDFIDSPKHNNSLKVLIAEYPNGVPDHIIRKVLRLPQNEVDSLYNSAILKLRESLTPDEPF